MDNRALKRFGKYTIGGLSTFFFDIALLFWLTDIVGINYVLAAALAFLLAVALNYAFSRNYVFHGTLRSVHAGYLGFNLIAGSGFLAVVILLPIFVEVWGWNYLLARTVIAGVVGLWNYFLNLYVNFRVAGKY
ncbi:MAG: GtrA family protein [Patescibacteria group bacterium]